MRIQSQTSHLPSRVPSGSPQNPRPAAPCFLDIIIIAILGTSAASTTGKASKDLPRIRRHGCVPFLSLPMGSSPHTFNRVFRLLDPGAFTENAFLGWVNGVRNKVPGMS